MKFNKKSITLNLDEINKIAGFAVEAHYYNNSKGHKMCAKDALEVLKNFIIT